MIERISAAVLVGLFACEGGIAQKSQAASEVKPFPTPVVVISDAKRFNAVQFGPDNTVTIGQVPKDFELEDIGLSSDGALLAIAWGSGRIEVRRASDGALLKQFNAGTWGPNFVEDNNLLISYKSGGEVLVSDWKVGKPIKKLKAELGPRRYDVRKVLYEPNLDWWAYVDGEEGRVVKLSDGKTVLTNFGAATDFALSHDGKRLWTIGRDAVRVYAVGDWVLEQEWKLRSPTPPTLEPEFSMGRTADGEEFAAVPSVDGLMIYPERLQQKIGVKGAAFVDRSDGVMLVEGPTMKLLALDGEERCEWKQFPYHRRTQSADGQWFAIADFQKVNIWNIGKLANSCQ